MAEAIIVDKVSKWFGPTKALADVSLTISRGESRALVGKNGAGKSTLMSILTGLTSPDAGAVQVLNESGAQDFSSVGCVYQRSTLVPGITAAENISLNRYPSRRRLIRWGAVRDRAAAALDEWGCADLADTVVDQLNPLQRKIVEICRVLAAGPKVLLLDEPTAGLDRAAARQLFGQMRVAHQRGVTMIYVSHHLHEIFEACDSVTVLRDGKVVATEPLQDMTMARIVEAMVGEAVADHQRSADPGRKPDDGAQPVLTARGLAAPPTVGGVDLQLWPGECVGLTGLDGAGHMRIGQILTGQMSPDEGTVELDGTRLPLGSIRGCIAAGIGYTPEDRHVSGYVPGLSVAENATLSVMPRFTSRFHVLRFRERDRAYLDLAERWGIKAHSVHQPVEELSGGNQQKVVLARSVAAQPRVLVLMNPTAGVDVSAKNSIYATIDELKRAGQSVLVISSDDGDLEICDRVLVMFDGRVIDELYPPFSESDLAAAVQGPAQRTSSASVRQPGAEASSSHRE